MIIQPFGPYSYVWERLAVGGISAYGESLKPFGFAMNVAWEFVEYPDLRGGIDLVKGLEVHHARLNDDDEIEPQIPEILRAVGLVGEAYAKGLTVLVTCAAGRNRSSLVVAEHLIQLGNKPEKVIAEIQARRDSALTNETFTNWLRRRRA